MKPAPPHIALAATPRWLSTLPKRLQVAGIDLHTYPEKSAK